MFTFATMIILKYSLHTGVILLITLVLHACGSRVNPDTQDSVPTIDSMQVKYKTFDLGNGWTIDVPLETDTIAGDSSYRIITSMSQLLFLECSYDTSSYWIRPCDEESKRSFAESRFDIINENHDYRYSSTHQVSYNDVDGHIITVAVPEKRVEGEIFAIVYDCETGERLDFSQNNPAPSTQELLLKMFETIRKKK